MPYHRIPRVGLHEDIRSIEREGEIVVQVIACPDGVHFDVFTRYVGQPGAHEPLQTRQGSAS